MRKYLPIILISLAILVIAGFAIFFKPNQAAKPGLSVVAAENFWGDIAKQIGGENISVTSIINSPTDDPHLYESGAKDALAITNANIVIKNGLGYDDFIDKILQTSPNNDRQVITAAEVIGASADSNPHIWYNINYINQIAQAIANALSSKDPANAQQYQKNLTEFSGSLKLLTDKIDQIASNHALAPIATTERVANYLLSAANLTVVSPESFAAAIEDGNEPSPSDQAAMEQLITDHAIKALIYNPQAESPATQTLRQKAMDAGIPVVNMTEIMPKNQTYQAWQYNQLDALGKALENNK